MKSCEKLVQTCTSSHPHQLGRTRDFLTSGGRRTRRLYTPDTHVASVRSRLLRRLRLSPRQRRLLLTLIHSSFASFLPNLHSFCLAFFSCSNRKCGVRTFFFFLSFTPFLFNSCKRQAPFS